MAGSEQQHIAPPDTMYCVNHPRTETLIRCSRCLDPICPKCQVRTPVGLRCKKCASIGRSPLYQPKPYHFLLGFAVALLLALVAGATVARLGLLLVFFLSAPVGGLIGEAVARVTHKRGRVMQILTGSGIALGTLLGPAASVALLQGIPALLAMNPLAYLGLLGLSAILFAVLAVGAAVARLR